MKQRKKIDSDQDLENAKESTSSEEEEEDEDDWEDVGPDDEKGKITKSVKVQSPSQEEQDFEGIAKYIPFYKYTDLDVNLYLAIYAFIRFFMVMRCCYNFVYPDQYWQSTEIAYDMVFGGVTVPWEWTKDNRIRNVLYPMYLSIPLRILKFLRLDYYYTIYESMQFFQFFLVFLGDYYFYKVGCKTIGKPATRIGLYLYVTSRFLNMHLLKCFGNSVETVLQVIIFNYYIDISNKFDKNVCMVAFLAIVSFMSRCTSPLGWVFLIFYKILFEGALIPLILAGFIVAVPTLLILMCIDSVFYETLTFVPYNFLYKNLVENVSVNYGVAPPTEYIYKTIPEAMDLLLLITLCAIVYNLYECVQKKEFPHFFMLILTFLISFSLIPHKEDRFILPTIPFLLLITAQFIYKLLVRFGKIAAVFFVVIIAWELLYSSIYYAFNEKYYRALYDLMSVDKEPHQIFVGTRYDMPSHSLLHMHRGKNKIDFFFHTSQGGNFGGYLSGMPGFNGWDGYWQCRDLVEAFKNGWWPPKYALIHDFVDKVHGGYSGKQCLDELTQRYDLVREYRLPYPQWAGFFNYHMNEYLMFQRKDSGEKYLMNLP